MSMDRNYNRRSDSSGSPRRSSRPAQKGQAQPRSSSSERAQQRSSRATVEYDQSAKTDLSSQAYIEDPRLRYARYRTDRRYRVLGTPEEQRLRNRKIIEPGFQYGLFMDSGGTDGSSSARRAGTRSVRGTTVREYRQRQRVAIRRQSKLSGRILAIALVLVALLAACFAIYSSPLFAIDNLEVEGAHHLSVGQIQKIAAIPQDSTLLRVDLNAIKGRVEAEPWVESVELHRSFPSTIVITVKERQVAAVVELASTETDVAPSYWLVSNDRIWLGSYDPQAVLAAEAAAAAAAAAEASEAAAEEAAAGESAATASEEAAAANEKATTRFTAAGSTMAGLSTAIKKAVNPDFTEETDVSSTDLEDSDTGTQTDEVSDVYFTPDGEVSLLANALVGPSEVKALPHIKDVSNTIEPLEGKSIDDEGVLNALSIINGSSPELLGIIRNISAPDKLQTMLSLTNNVEVAYGAAVDTEAKERVILFLLSEHEGKIAHINVRKVDRPTFKTID